MASYRLVMDEIHVLLVDHESQDANNTTRLLEMCQYKVTPVELASFAIKLLLRGKTKFDVVIANINSLDFQGLSLLQHAVSTNIPIILMSTDDNTTMAKRAIEEGACLYIKKPATIEMLRSLWQHVLRENTRMVKERDRLTTLNYSLQGIKFEEMAHNLSTTMLMVKERDNSKEKLEERKRPNSKEDYNSENDMIVVDNKNRKRVCIEWTEELHKKFINAIEELGEGRCFPKYILEFMNVHSLTRMQVASHLQKCRNNNWRPRKQQKSNSTIQLVSSDNIGSQQNPKRVVPKLRFGRAPSSHAAIKEPNDAQDENTKTQAIMINTSHEPHPNDTKPGSSSSDLQPPPGFEQKHEVPSPTTKGKGSSETSNHESETS